MKLFVGSLLASLMFTPLLANAAEGAAVSNPLSVHVLNLQTGVPTAGIVVELEQQQKDSWIRLGSGTTDSNGRIAALFPEGKKLESGDYKVVFKTGDYYKKVGQPTFFPEVPVIFHAEEGGHYHIPLLLSQYGYSTYRGN